MTVGLYEKTKDELKIDLGCSNNKKKGYLGVDVKQPFDIFHDLNILPYPFEDESVNNIYACHILEHLDIRMTSFLSECYRILKPYGELELLLPNAYYWKERLDFLFGKYIPSYHPFHKKFLKPSDVERYLKYLGCWIKPQRSCNRFPFENLNRDWFAREIKLIARKYP